MHGHLTRVKIFFDRETYSEMEKDANNPKEMSLLSFGVWFNIWPVIKKILKKDRFLKRVPVPIKHIRIKIGKKDKVQTAAVLLYLEVQPDTLPLVISWEFIKQLAGHIGDKRSVYQDLKPYLEHELFHFFDVDKILKQRKGIYKAHGISVDNPAQSLERLYAACEEHPELNHKGYLIHTELFVQACREEGLARVRERYDAPEIVLDRSFLHRDERVAFDLVLKESTLQPILFIDESDFCYLLGEYMVIVIILARMAKRNTIEKLSFSEDGNKFVSFEEIKGVLGDDQPEKIFIKGLTSDDLDGHLIDIRKANPKIFVRYYDAACNYLRIPEWNRVLSRRVYHRLLEIGKEREKEYEHLLDELGFAV